MRLIVTSTGLVLETQRQWLPNNLTSRDMTPPLRIPDPSTHREWLARVLMQRGLTRGEAVQIIARIERRARLDPVRGQMDRSPEEMPRSGKSELFAAARDEIALWQEERAQQ
jgi:hypothetical protein